MKKLTKQAICYIAGLLIISIGVNFSKLSGLGITPVSSIPRACEEIWGLTLGNTTLLIYLILIALQFVVLRKDFKLRNALGIAVTFLFSFMIDLTGSDPNAFGHLLAGLPKPDNYLMSLFYMVIGMGIVAFGVFLYLIPKWVPMPAEGLAEAISSVTGKAFGDCKTMIDTSMMGIALILQLVFCGGLASFQGESIIVREGTILCALVVGQIVKVFSKKYGEAVRAWIEDGQ